MADVLERRHAVLVAHVGSSAAHVPVDLIGELNHAEVTSMPVYAAAYNVTTASDRKRKQLERKQRRRAGRRQGVCHELSLNDRLLLAAGVLCLLSACMCACVSRLKRPLSIARSPTGRQQREWMWKSCGRNAQLSLLPLVP